MDKKTITVAVTGAAGRIGYALLPRLVNGEAFGPDIRVNLNLIEIPPMVPKLDGVQMELEDSAFPNLGTVTKTSDLQTGFADAHWVLLLGSMPRGVVVDGKKIEERSDLLRINGGIFTEQGRAIGRYSQSDARILVVGNPANTNALIGASHCGVDTQTWLAMTALDANRARAQLAFKAETTIDQVKQLCIWGNHSPTMYPDVFNARIGNDNAFSAVGESLDWLQQTFLPTVQQRGKAIIDASGASSAQSAANAVLNTVQCVETPTAQDDWFSAALLSDGSYGTPEGLIYGMPLRSDGRRVSIVQGLEINDFSQSYIDITTAELESERADIVDLLKS